MLSHCGTVFRSASSGFPDFVVDARRDPRYWRISLCNASSLNRGIQLSSSNMCGDTVEFCMRMHFGRDFLDTPRERRRWGGASSERFIRRNCVEFSCAPYTEKLHLECDSTGRGSLRSSHHSHGCHLLKFKTLLLQNVCRDFVLNHVVISSEEYRMEKLYPRAREFTSSAHFALYLYKLRYVEVQKGYRVA